jgi:hypothetical protein
MGTPDSGILYILFILSSPHSCVSRGYEFCLMGVANTQTAAVAEGTETVSPLRTCGSANSRVGFRVMLGKHARSNSPF